MSMRIVDALQSKQNNIRHERKKVADSKFSLVAVAGLNGHAFGSFRAKNRSDTFIWLRDALPHDIHNVRIFTYGYPSKLVASQCFETIKDLGGKFRVALRRVKNSFVCSFSPLTAAWFNFI